MANDPWAFGWTQLLTIIGFCITIGIAIGGFKTFGRWKREKIDELRMTIALEALSIAYETQFVFDGIRNPGSFGNEYADMKRGENESLEQYEASKTGYPTLKRVDDNKDFFQRVFKLQPRFMAVFGPQTEVIFKELYQARANVVVSAQAISRYDDGPFTEAKAKRRTRYEGDIWSGAADSYSHEELPEGDRVQKRLDEFKNGISTLCRPVVDQEFRSTK